MNFEQIQYTVEDRILTITLNRPERMNACTVRMYEELIARANATRPGIGRVRPHRGFRRRERVVRSL